VAPGARGSLFGLLCGPLIVDPLPSPISVKSDQRERHTPTYQVQLVTNLRAAKAFGLNVPLSIRQRADEVIE
jgi:hypothetical protein